MVFFTNVKCFVSERRETIGERISFVLWFLVSLFVATRLIGTAEVIGDSMLPSYADGDLLFVLKAGFVPSCGDVLVVESNDHYIIKRVVALGGSTVDIRDQKVYVDGVMQDEPYITKPTFAETVEMPVKVSKDSLFLMGDNRTNSKDSRCLEVGNVSKRDVIGKVLFTIKRGK